MLITTCLCEHSVRVYLHVHTDCKSCCASQRRVSLAELASSFVVKLFDALSQVPTQPFFWMKPRSLPLLCFCICLTMLWSVERAL